MSSYNLYRGGFGVYQHYTVAESEDTAIKNIQEFYNMKHLPVTVEIVDNINGFKIVPTKAGDEIEDTTDIQEEGTEPKRTRRKETS